MSGAAPATASPIPKSVTEVSSGPAAPRRSAHCPARTMPTTLVATVAANASANQRSPSRSCATVGMIVATASASKAAMKTSETPPTVAAR